MGSVIGADWLTSFFSVWLFTNGFNNVGIPVMLMLLPMCAVQLYLLYLFSHYVRTKEE